MDIFKNWKRVFLNLHNIKRAAWASWAPWTGIDCARRADIGRLPLGRLHARPSYGEVNKMLNNI